MASEYDTTDSTTATTGEATAGTAGEITAPTDAPPAKKAARKRATRKTATAPSTVADPATQATDGPTQPTDTAAAAEEAGPDGLAAPARTRTRTTAAGTTATRKRGASKAATAAPATETTEAAATSAVTGTPEGDAPKAPRKRASKRTAVSPDSASPGGSEGGPLVDERALALDAPTDPATGLESAGSQASGDGGAPEAEARVTDLGAVFQAPVAPRRRSTSSGTASAGTAPTRRSRRASSAAAAPVAAGSETDPSLDEDELTSPGIELDATDAAVPETATAEATDRGLVQESEPDGDDTSTPRRRRRRGGKGRRGRGSSADDASDDAFEAAAGAATAASSEVESADAQVTADPEEAEASEEASEGTTSSRRRTRRRRRSGGGGETDDAPGVTTRVREPREPREPREREPRGARDEVTALKGSTRLEAKKQRRREGREAGRRRTVITEAEFLARRESVERVMVVRHNGERTQIGVLEDGVLVEHYISKETSVSMAGNIYLGRVQNVLPSMEAAFVDIGKGRNAVLYAGEVNWDAAGLEGNQAKRIENALSSGESVLVQVTKDPIGHKGARLTSQISLPGRYLVYVPDSSMTGISRKLPDIERARLKKILKEVVPSTAGVIVRTAAEGASEEELRADVERLTATWDEIVAKAESAGGTTTKGKNKGKSGNAPVLLHGEPDLTVRVIRDIFNEDFASLVVAGEQAWQEVSDYVGSVAPDLAERVTRWTSEQDLFTHYRVDEQIAKAMDRKVWLPSGGSLVIDRTEAMTVVDVNTGKFIGSGGNLEETVTKNNIEAAEEIVRQLRLRDVGGIIVIDFIDMVLESNRDLVVRRLLECLGRDRTKHQVAEVTSLGLVQMTRKRVGSGLIEVFSETCEHCAGRGFIIHTEPVDKSNGGGGSFHDHGSSGSQGGGRSQSSQSSRGRQTEQTPPSRPSGPTPAQIAAAAHAAAMKTAEQAVSEVLADAGMPDADVRDAIEALEPVAIDVVEFELDLPDTVDLPDRPEVSGHHGVSTDPDDAAEPPEPPEPAEAPEVAARLESELAAEREPEQAMQPREPAYIPPVPPPIGAPASTPRRRRGRVVAPAGPPRAALHHDDSGA